MKRTLLQHNKYKLKYGQHNYKLVYNYHNVIIIYSDDNVKIISKIVHDVSTCILCMYT